MSDAIEVLTVQEGQAAVKQVAVSGEIISLPSATDVKAIVQTDKGPVAAIKTVSLGGGGGGGGGDYLPLSGGTLTGALNINPEVSAAFGDVLVLSYGDNDVVIQKSRYEKSLNLVGTTLTVGKLMAGGMGVSKSNIGSPTSSFGCVYTAQLSGSTSFSDEHYLSVPNKDGTIATVEDIDAAVGDISTALTAIIGE